MKNLNNKNDLEQSDNKDFENILKDIKHEQEQLKQIIVDNHKILMKRINKLQEYNEICDMRNRNLYNELKGIKEKL